ncbi:MAG: hypothetical protein HRK26_02175 [Rickettsiaceae bacterium H1]|nr:hypothetical protein [Rickettsiaceae bacterium H1]
MSIAIAASTVKPNDILLVTPSDAYIENQPVYRNFVKKAINSFISSNTITSILVNAKNSYLPYGYVKLTKSTGDYDIIEKFIKKPKSLINYKDYYWNTGIFICSAKIYLSYLKRHSSYLSYKCNELLRSSYSDSNSNLYISPVECELRHLSVDRITMEKIKK